jgi:hypothetical protein
MVGARTVDTFWNKVSSSHCNYFVILFHPSMNRLVVIIENFCPSLKAQRLTQNGIPAIIVGQ